MIVVHCTGTEEGKDVSVQAIRNYHVNHNGWRDIGYHYVIYRDGTVHDGVRPGYEEARIGVFEDKLGGLPGLGLGSLGTLGTAGVGKAHQLDCRLLGTRQKDGR